MRIGDILIKKIRTDTRNSQTADLVRMQYADNYPTAE